MCRPLIISSSSTIVVGFIGVKCIMGLIGMEYVVVGAADGLAKLAYSLKIESLQLCLL